MRSLERLEAEMFYRVFRSHLAMFELALTDLIQMPGQAGGVPKSKFQAMLRDVKKWQSELYQANKELLG